MARAVFSLAVITVLIILSANAQGDPPRTASQYRDMTAIGGPGPLATTLKPGDKIKVLYALRLATKSPYPGIPPGAIAPANNDLPMARFEFGALSKEQRDQLAKFCLEECICMGSWWITFLNRANDTLNNFNLDGFDELDCH